MPYGDDLYKEENIFAYTGKIGNNPTVYFQRDVRNKYGQNLKQFGHITQYHDNNLNVGKEQLMYSPVYYIENEMVQNKNGGYEERNVEYAYLPKKNGQGYEIRDFHTSRDKHTLVKANDHHIRRKLAQEVLPAFPEVKPKYIETFTKNRIEKHRNDKDFEKKLDYMDEDIDYVIQKKIDKKPERKGYYVAQGKQVKAIVQKERNKLAKHKKKAAAPKEKFLVAMNQDNKPNNHNANAKNNNKSPKKNIDHKKKHKMSI